MGVPETFVPEQIHLAKPENPTSRWEAFKGSVAESNVIAAGVTYNWRDRLSREELERSRNFDYRDYMPADFEQDFGIDYAQTRTPQEAYSLTTMIHKQREYRRNMENHPYVSFGAVLAGAALSPEQFPLYALLPTGAILSQTARARIGLAVSQGAGYGAAAGAASEFALQGIVPERSVEESLFTVGASAIFGGGLGALGATARELPAALAHTDHIMRTLDSHPIISELGPIRNFDGTVPEEVLSKAQNKVDQLIAEGKLDPEGRDVAVQEMVKDTLEQSSQLKHPKMYKVLGYLSPAVRLATAPIHSARKLASQLTDTPLHRKDMVTDPSIELTLRMQTASLIHRVDTSLNTRYKEYLDATRGTEGRKLTKSEFNEAVGDAHAAGDVHENPFIQDAAKDTRKALKDIEDRLVASELIAHKYEGWENVTSQDLHRAGIDPELIATLRKQIETPDGQVSVLDVESLRGMDKEVHDALYDAGLLTRHAAEPIADRGYFHRQYDIPAIKQDTNKFVDTLYRAFMDEFNDVHVASKINEKIQARELEISKREAALTRRQESEGYTPEAVVGRTAVEEAQLKKLRTERRRELREEITEAHKNKVSADHIKALNEELRALSGRKNSDEQLIANAKAEVARLKAIANEKWDDVKLEARKQAEQVVNKILHQDYKEGFRYTGLESITLKGRTIHVPYEKLQGFLNRNASDVWGSWAEKTLPDLLMAEKFGKKGFGGAVKAVLDDFDAARANAKSPKEAKQVNKAKEAWERDIRAMELMIHNRYGMSDDPSSILHRGGQYLRWHNMVTKLGQMTISAVPDLGFVVARQGANALQFNKYMWSPSVKAKAYREFLNDIGVMADITNSQRLEQLNLVDTRYGVRNKADRFARKAVQKFNTLTGMNHWNAHLKRFVAGVYGMGITRDAHKLAAGTLSKADIHRYANSFLSESDLRQIAKLTKAGDPPDVTNWPSDLQQRFKAALFREADTTIVTPTGGDLPLASKTDMGRLVLQFKSFAIASNHRMLMTTIDDLTAQKLIGIASMVFFGHISHITKNAIQGKETDMDDFDGLLTEAVSRAGIMALFSEANTIVERASGGNASLFAAIGLEADPVSFHSNQSLADLVFGPTAGTIADVKRMATAAAKGEIGEAEARAIRRSMWLQNWWGLHRAFNELEKGLVTK